MWQGYGRTWISRINKSSHYEYVLYNRRKFHIELGLQPVWGDIRMYKNYFCNADQIHILQDKKVLYCIFGVAAISLAAISSHLSYTITLSTLTDFMAAGMLFPNPTPMADLTGLFTHTKSFSEAKCFIFPPEYI